MLQEVVVRLAAILDAPRSRVRLQTWRGTVRSDAVARIGRHTFVIEWKDSGRAGPVATAAQQVKRAAAKHSRGAIPIVAVPYMGDAGRDACERAGVAWLDLSGNARLVAPGIRVIIEGRPSRFTRRGRPANPFAPKSSRIARWLLVHSDQAVSQRELARLTSVDEGLTSRVVAKLEEDGLLVREASAVRARDPGLLLDAWRERYDFSKHEVIRGHIAARSGEDALRSLAQGLRLRRMTYAVTALAAAWLHARFAGFRLVAAYLQERPTPALVQELAFRADPRGANVWLVLPNDQGVFEGASDRDGVHCVHPVQAYLDLKAHPERSSEAAERLRSTLLRWDNRG